MKSMFKVLLLAMVITTLIVAGCSKKDKETGIVSDPANYAALTDSYGLAAFTVGTIDVNATVTDSSQTPLPGIAVNAFLLPNYLMLIAVDSTDTYYPTISVTSLDTTGSISSVPSNDRLNSPQGIQQAAAEVTMVMYETQVAAFGFNPDIPNFAEIFNTGWTSEDCGDFILQDLYNFIDSSNENYGQCVFIHLDDDVKELTGSEFGTVAFLPTAIGDFNTFAALAGYTLRLFQGDSLQTCWTRYGDIGLPMIQISDAGLNRNFWCQFTLIWGENPSDLDSHLWTPVIQGDSFHIAYYSRGSASTPPYADLDVDDVTSFGPEHVTIYDEFAGTYTYAIYEFSGLGNISTSEAIVSLIKPDGSVQTFEVPTTGAGDYWWWHVCTIDGATGVVTVINQLSPNPPQPEYIPANVTQKVRQ